MVVLWTAFESADDSISDCSEALGSITDCNSDVGSVVNISDGLESL